MKFSFATHLFVATSLASLSLTACASSGGPSLPFQTNNSSTGAVSSVRTYERGDRLFVSGTARPALASAGNHVDIQLIDATGTVIAEERETIHTGHPRGSKSRHGGDAFTASFPLDVARKASRVNVTFHSSSH